MIDAIGSSEVYTRNDSKLKNLNLDTLSKDQKKLKEVCDDFESFFLQQILDVSLRDSSLAGEGTGSEILKSLYTEGMSKTSNGAFGISNLLYEHLSKKI